MSEAPDDFLDLTGFDFLDYGCSTGGSLAMARRRFGGVRGLGIDINPVKAQAATNAGQEVMVADATRMPRVAGRVRFCVMSHFLEHLPSFAAAKRCVREALLLTESFIYVQQPWFDSDPYLFRQGLKLYWSDWTGHPNRMTSLEFHCILWPLLEKSRIARYCIYAHSLIADSSAPEIHSICSPADCRKWRDGIDPKKHNLEFTDRVYRELRLFVALQEPCIIDDLEKRIQYSEKLFDSSQFVSATAVHVGATVEVANVHSEK